MSLERIALRVFSVVGFIATAVAWALGLCGWVCAGGVLLAYLGAFLLTLSEPPRLGPVSEPRPAPRPVHPPCQCARPYRGKRSMRCVTCGGVLRA